MAGMSSPNPRDFDVVVFGATGFTGRLVAEYYLKEYGPSSESLKWAVAGRSQPKMEKLLSELGATGVPIIVCDSNDTEALSAMAKRTKVVVTTVGPFTKYGFKLAEACATYGTHYADLTGEPPFVKTVVTQLEAKAKASGAKIVCCAGFDSQPSDLGTLLVVDAMKQQEIVPRQIKMVVGPVRGGFSGGTIHSVAGALEHSSLHDFVDPKMLVSKGSKSFVRVKDHLALGWDSDLRRWTIPFIMASINTRVVVRSGSLLGYDAFTYSETLSFEGTLLGFLTAAVGLVGLSTFLVLFLFPPTRWLILQLLPAGSGPDEKARKNGYVTIYFIGKGTKAGKDVTVRATIQINGDPGYQETAKMIGESGVCLAKDALAIQGGVLTPAAAMGTLIIDRLNHANISIKLDGN